MYRRLECGIVVRLNEDGSTDWPYGPRQGTRLDNCTDATEEDFCAQQRQVWAEMPPLMTHAGPEVYDVMFAAVGYAILTYDDSRGASLKTYASRMARYAIAASKRIKEDRTVQLSEHEAAENNIGQIEANLDIYRYKAELSREQWSLLLARFDSHLSYDEIAREFNFGSRTTAMNKIEQALAACRKLILLA